MATVIRTAQHALNVLRSARNSDAKATTAYVKGIKAAANNGSYSGHFQRSERWADTAAADFERVEAYLESLTRYAAFWMTPPTKPKAIMTSGRRIGRKATRAKRTMNGRTAFVS